VPPFAKKEIFISHVNGDEEAEKVLKALDDRLRETLGPGFEDYKVVYDTKEVRAGAAWRKQIKSWIDECHAAVVLISEGMFKAHKPWVRYEFALLSSRWEKGGLGLVPVLVGNVAKKYKSDAVIKAFNLGEVQTYTCPDVSDLAVAEAVRKIADGLRAGGLASRPPPGLAASLARIFELHPGLADAVVYALERRRSSPGQLAQELIDHNDHDEIFRAYEAMLAYLKTAATTSTDRGALAEMLHKLLAASFVPDEAAKSFAGEMAKAPEIARPIVIESTSDPVSELYVVRAAGKFPHNWRLLDVVLVQELNTLDQFAADIEGALIKTFAVPSGTSADRAREAQEDVREMRRHGRPAVLRIDLPDECDSAAVRRTAHATAPNCGLMFRVEAGAAGREWPAQDYNLLPPVRERDGNRQGRFYKTLDILRSGQFGDANS